MSIETLRSRLQSGPPVFNAFLTIPGAWTAELVASSGWESVTLDLQHGLIDFATALSMMQAIAGTPAATFIRLSWNDPARIMQALDAGAEGVICPMISQAADVEAFLGACHFPPEGYRSFGPIRASLRHPDDFRRPLTFAMIETAASVDHLYDIAAVPGLDGLYVGPNDLSISLGLDRRADFQDPSLLAILDEVLIACQAHRLIPAVFTSHTEDACRMAARGFRLVSCGSDSSWLHQVARQQRKALEG